MRGRVTISLLAASLLMMTGSRAVAFYQWPDTGQTTCYDSVGNAITCGTAYPGQDAVYDGPTKSYDTTTETGTVIDNVTKLQWYNPDPNPLVENLSYADAEAYVATLNSTGPHNDWRMPTIKELVTIVDLSMQPWVVSSEIYGPFVMPVDAETGLGGNDAIFWSATDSPINPDHKLVVRFRSGLVNDGAGAGIGGSAFGDVAYVRPVRNVTH